MSYGAMLFEFRQEWQKAEQQAKAAITLSTHHGFALFSIMGALVCGGALSELEDGDAGRSMIAVSATDAECAGAQLLRSYGLGMLARAHGKAGLTDNACAIVAEALAVTERTGERFYEAELHRLHGELLLRSGRPELDVQAEACFRRAIDIATEQRALSWKLRAVVSLARLFERLGRGEEAHGLLAETYSAFTEGKQSVDLQDAAALLGAYPTVRE